MISFINIKNFAVVEETSLDLSEGFNVLTGETGAGKSIIIDALSLLLKKKIQPHLFRNIEKKLIIEIMFVIDEEEFILKREATKSKSVSFINGDMVPFIKLVEKMSNLLNIYGQNEHIYLLKTKNHSFMLDLFCKNEKILTELEKTYDNLKEKIKIAHDLELHKNKRDEKIDYIEFQLKELDELGMNRGDDKLLRKESKIQSSAQEIISGSNAIVEEFYQGENSIYGRIAQNLNSLNFLSNMYPEIDSFKNEINRFYNLLPELSASLSDISGKLEYNENTVNEIETKLLKLNKLEDKYKTDLNGLIDKAESLRFELEDLKDIDTSIVDINKKIDNIFNDYKKLNKDLYENRIKGSEILSKIVETELEKLEMKKARFEVKIDMIVPTLDNISPRGSDRVEFYFSSNPGQNVAKIKDVASGGELSRLMLVLKSITDEKNNATYIFDEIDTGIGGKTAEFVGHKLNSIAKKNQVICISHLPQIAAFADKHFLIKKEFKNNNTFSYTQELSEQDRVNEIARLMAGTNTDNSILEAAKSLLANIRHTKK